MYTKITTLAILAFSLIIAPIFVSAASTGDVDPLVSTNTCTNLTYDLRRSSRDSQTGGQVSDLQFFLQTKGYFNIEPTGYFGLMTFAAVKEFQAKNAITPVSGFVGPITRKAINSLGCVTVATTPTSTTNTTSSVQGCKAGSIFSSTTGQKCVNGNTTTTTTTTSTNTTEISKHSIKVDVSNSKSYKAEDSVTFNWNANYSTGPLYAYIYNSSDSTITSRYITTSSAGDSSILIPAGTSNGKYYIKVCDQGSDIKNPICGKSSSFSVASSEVSNPSLKIISPNGGENLTVNSSSIIKWDAKNIEGDVAILLVNTAGSGCSIATASAKSEEFTYTPIINSCLTTPGKYKLHITKWSSSMGFNFGIEDFSDDYFTINSATETTPTQPTPTSSPASIEIKYPNGGENLEITNDPFTTTLYVGWNINYQPKNQLRIYLENQNGDKVINKLLNSYVKTDFINRSTVSMDTPVNITSGNYKIKICDESFNGGSLCDSSNNYFTITK